MRWDYLAATDKGYFPYHVDDLEVDEAVSNCPRYIGAVTHDNTRVATILSSTKLTLHGVRVWERVVGKSALSCHPYFLILRIL